MPDFIHSDVKVSLQIKYINNYWDKTNAIVLDRLSLIDLIADSKCDSTFKIIRLSIVIHRSIWDTFLIRRKYLKKKLDRIWKENEGGRLPIYNRLDILNILSSGE